MKYRYAEHFIDNDDISAVVQALKNKNLTKGNLVFEFEENIKNEFKFKHSLAVNSGTAALHLAVKALEINEGDEIIVPSITFASTANVVEMCGGKVVFADILMDSLLIDIENVQIKITKKTKAIIAVDMAGQLCNYKKLRKLCDKYNLALISDSCHSFGINYFLDDEKPDFICFSFHPAKNITTGEGGMVLTDNENFYKSMEMYREHGFSKFRNMVRLGYNYRMPEINAALGLSQFKKIDKFIYARQSLARLYYNKLKKYSLNPKSFPNSTFHLYILKINSELRDVVREHLNFHEIQTQIHYKPVYCHQYYARKYSKNLSISLSNELNCPNTDKIKNEILTIPLYVSMTNFDINYISEKIIEVLEVD